MEKWIALFKKRKFKLPEVIIAALLAVGAWYWQLDFGLQPEKPIKLTGKCEDNLYQGKAPVIESRYNLKESQELCYSGYAARASFVTKSNLYSAERLTAERVSVKLNRENTFYEDRALPEFKRATLADYKTSGYDRGHLAPSADMPTKKSQHESFSLANMVPQVREHNQHTWAKVESKVRALAKEHKEIFVVTMPMYVKPKEEQNPKGDKVKVVGASKVFVPFYMVKAIYVPSLNKAVVILSPNDKSNRVYSASLDYYQKLNGIDVFPALSDDVKKNKGDFFKW